MGKYKVLSELKRKRKKESDLNDIKVIPEKTLELKPLQENNDSNSNLEESQNITLTSSDSDFVQKENFDDVVQNEELLDFGENEGIIEKLRKWSFNHNISRNAISDLLRVVKANQMISILY